MRDVVGLARIHGTDVVDEALGTAVAYGRLDTGDLTSLLTTAAPATSGRHVSGQSSLAQGTDAWASI